MCKILLIRGVNEYRKTIPLNVFKNDKVLEIGFAWGTTTNLLAKHANTVVGIDKGESFYTAVKTYPKLNLFKIDGFGMRAVLDLKIKFI